MNKSADKITHVLNLFLFVLSFFLTFPFGRWVGSFLGVVVNVLANDTAVNDLNTQSNYYVHFQISTHGKGKNFFILPYYRKGKKTLFILPCYEKWRNVFILPWYGLNMTLAQHNLHSLYAIKHGYKQKYFLFNTHTHTHTHTRFLWIGLFY